MADADTEFDELTKAIKAAKAALAAATTGAAKAAAKKKLNEAIILRGDLMAAITDNAINAISKKRKKLQKEIAKLRSSSSTIPKKPKKPKKPKEVEAPVPPVPQRTEAELTEVEHDPVVADALEFKLKKEIPDKGDTKTLTEAHLVALFRRSFYPVPTGDPVVFGIRGCRPINYGGTKFAFSHGIRFVEPNYRTMNCTIGIWRPGRGFALFPGSTVPYIKHVKDAQPAGGSGVNQMGRGRYKGYYPGWHPADPKKSRHWALRQGRPITLQRTADDTDYDEQDTWSRVGMVYDNIHCARHMGPDDNIPESRYSSQGCQVIAGTVIGNKPGSEAGPWAKFISNFKGNDAPVSIDYTLFSGREVERMMEDHLDGGSYILRFGSAGPAVTLLQKKLAVALNRPFGFDEDFGMETFLGLIDYQIQTFGKGADDGIVGPGTADRLSLKLPEFKFVDAVAGKVPKTTGQDESIPAPAPAGGVKLVPKTSNPLLKKDFYRFTSPPGNSKKKAIYNTYLDYFKSPDCWYWLEQYGLAGDSNRLAHFFAQAAQESGGFTLFRENMKYSADRIKVIWRARVTINRARPMLKPIWYGTSATSRIGLMVIAWATKKVPTMVTTSEVVVYSRRPDGTTLPKPRRSWQSTAIMLTW